MPAEWLLKSFGVRFTVQRFTTWLETIRDSVDIFRQPGEYTAEEREKSLTLADVAIDDCVNAVKVGLADNFRAIGGHDPRDWFATTLTTAKKLRRQLWAIHKVLKERPDAWLTETLREELKCLNGELRDRADLLEDAASTLPIDKADDAPGYLGLIVKADGTVRRAGFDPVVQVSGTVNWPMFLALYNAADAGLSKRELARLPGDKGATARRKAKQNLKDKLHRPLNITIPNNEWKLTEA